MDCVILGEGQSWSQIVHKQVLSVFESLLRAVIVLENKGRSGGAEMLHDCLFVSDFLIIDLTLVDLHCDHLREVDDGFFSGNLKVISPSFPLGLRCSHLRQL